MSRKVAERETDAYTYMGFFKDLKSWISDEVDGETTVEVIEKMFRFVKEKHPDEDQYEVLTAVWSRMMETHGKRNLTSIARIQAMRFACLPYPVSARAMALTILHILKPQIVQKYPKFSTELFSLMPVVERLYDACDAESLNALFAKHNPRTPLPLFNKEEMVLLKTLLADQR